MPDKTDLAILVVDDDPAVRKLLNRCFAGEGYIVFEAGNGSEMFAQLQRHAIDLITLDLSLGREDGLDLARQIRAESEIPIIMVSGRGELIDTVLGLEIGADDYITKPFELREVIARIRTVLRRSQNNNEQRQTPDDHLGNTELFAFAEWILDPATRELTDLQNTSGNLTSGEYDLLEILVSHARQVLTRDQIMDRMKGHDWNPTDRTIDNHIARLRKKLQTPNNTTPLIKTIRGAGYMLTADVRRIERSQADSTTKLVQ